MKKSRIAVLGGLLGLIAVAAVWATTVVYTSNLVDEDIAVAKTFVLDSKTSGRNGLNIDLFSAQAVYSTATITAVTFTDGSKSVGNISVSNNNNLVGAKATGQITVSSTSTLKNSYVVINGKKLRNGYDWFTKDTTTNTAAALATLLDKVANIDASSSNNIVYATAAAVGVDGNAYALVKQGSGLSVSGAVFSGGVDNAYVTINGTKLLQGTAWTRQSTASGTAKAISDAIVASSPLSVITSTWSSSVAYATSTAVGAAKNFSLVGYPSASLVVSGAAMTGGTNAAYALSGTAITSASHGLVTGLGVLYTTGSAVGITNLTPNTTYFAVRTDANSFKLSATSTGAVAGLAITLGSLSSAGSHNFVLTPLALSGSWGITWEKSNDNSNWVDAGVSTVTFSTPFTAATTVWDFGTLAYRYLRASVVKGTNGAVRLKITGYGRNNN